MVNRMKEQIKKAMRDNLICSKEEAVSAIEFVRNLLEIDVEETQKNQPHAIFSIREMKIAISRVSDLEDNLLNDIE